MTARLTKNAIDVGVVVQDAERSLGFWRDFLGFALDEVKDLPGGAGRQYRLRCGESLVKLLALPEPPASGPGGGLRGAGGYRYLTLFVSNLEEVVEGARVAGYRVAMEPQVSPIFPNRIAFLEDPDGNWVEFFETV